MRVTKFFTVLETTNSEVSKKTLFKTRKTEYIPDCFVIYFYVTLLLFSVSLDVFILILLTLHTNKVLALIFGATLVPHSLCEYFALRKENNSILSCLTLKAANFLLYMLGLGSLFTSVNILMKAFRRQLSSKTLITNSYNFFNITSEKFSIIKVSSFILLVLKSIPQLFIISVYILENHMASSSGFLLANLLVNMVIFSHTIATTFPIRRTPRVFTSCNCVVLNSGNKFFGTMCACSAHLVVFAMLFRKIKYWAFLTHFIKTLLWSWPCWQVLKNQPIPLSQFAFLSYLIFITLIFGFIYIHPFEGEGKLYYYFFYLITFFIDLVCIYMFSEAKIDQITFFFTLRALMIGFLSCFGLLNIMHKYREDQSKINSFVDSSKLQDDDDKKLEESSESSKDLKVEEEKSSERVEETDSELQTVSERLQKPHKSEKTITWKI